MKDKILRAVAIATVSVISAALVAYLKNPENMEAAKRTAEQYQLKFQKTARKTRKTVNKKLKQLQI